MKYFQLTFLCLLCVAKSYGQTAARTYSAVVVEITKQKNPKKITIKVEITSAFPGGDSSWIQSIEKDLNQTIPFKNGAKTGKYTASVGFLVEKDGSFSDVRCIKDPGFGMCQQIVTVIRKKSRWGPSPLGKVREYQTPSTTRYE